MLREPAAQPWCFSSTNHFIVHTWIMKHWWAYLIWKKALRLLIVIRITFSYTIICIQFCLYLVYLSTEILRMLNKVFSGDSMKEAHIIFDNVTTKLAPSLLNELHSSIRFQLAKIRKLSMRTGCNRKNS